MTIYNSHNNCFFVIVTERVERMKLCIRAHDLGVKGSKQILAQMDRLGLDGVQMVCHKAYEDVPYDRGGMDAMKAEAIGAAFAQAGKTIPMVGAYFNPVHSDREKVSRCFDVFGEYLHYAKAMGSTVVGSETGSYNDDKWTYHPSNRTEEALDAVVDTFRRLADLAAGEGAVVAMEGAAGHVCWNIATLAEVQQRIARPNLRVIFDLYNYLDKDNQFDYLHILEEGLRTFAGKICLFHLKDCEFSSDTAPKQVPFGTGQMDLKAVLGKIKAYDPDATLVLEGTTGEHIATAVKTVREIWETL